MSHSTYKMPSPAKIQEWKKQFNEIHKIVPNPETPEIFCIVRHPKLIDILSSSVVGGSDDYKIGMSQLNDCWLEGDERIKTDIEYSRAAAVKMGTIFRVFESKLEFIPLTEELEKDIPADKLARAKKDGEVRKLTVFVDGDSKSVLLHKPNLEDVEKASTSSNPVDMGTIYLQECWIHGDEDLKSGKDEVRFAAYLGACGLLRRFTANVEKL